MYRSSTVSTKNPHLHRGKAMESQHRIGMEEMRWLCVWVCVCVYLCVYMHSCTYVCVCLCMWINLFMYVCMSTDVVWLDVTVIVKTIRTEARNWYFKMISTAQPLCAYICVLVSLLVLSAYRKNQQHGMAGRAWVVC